ncbi:MAG: 2-oxoglutarate dehydrogenase complex dihydrolipoyllysine-residue succinyltransferase [Sphingobacteriaceae bacterium]|nr:2-oxoglutarate dehydrogenase complex dihydrolipoyllysine-residue succinyltransferase [Sphingobacteriaceae bacterium]
MALEVKIPALGESISEVVIAKWLKKDGDFVKMDEVLCELETDKATMELNAEQAGVLKIIAAEGATLAIGDVVCSLDTDAKAPAAAAPAAEAAPATAAAPSAAAPAGQQTYASGHPSPAAAKILAEKGMDASAVAGTGKDGRVTKEDALKAEAAAPKAAAPAASTAAAAPAAPAGERNQRRERMSQLRKTVARRLVSVKNETAMLTTFNEVNMGPVMELRSRYKDKFKEKYGVGLGFMSFFTRAVCLALQEFPAVNGMIDGEELVYNDYCDISIAVSAPRGLVVPVIRNAEKLGLHEIEAEVGRLAKRARENQLTLEEMTGGTFTITNGGVFGSMLSTPIINAPQSAILGMHNIVERPIALNGEVVIRPVMYIALSYDHRIIDGRESVSFLYRVKEYLEDPARMLMGI